MIVIELKGGLGNQMFQYALGRHLSIKNNCELYLDCGYLLDRRFKKSTYTYRDFDLDIFDLSPLFASKEISKKYGLLRPKYLRLIEPVFKLATLQRLAEKRSAFTSSILETNSNTYLTGYWQSENYFIDIAEQIRKDFVIKMEEGTETSNWCQLLSSQNSVCVHVRRTDYVNNPILDVMDQGYYNRAEEILQNLVGAMSVYVFSDDIEWCKTHIRLRSKTIFMSSGKSKIDLKNDLFLMSQCKHFILPNSTFSWWGAWLSSYEGKRVICPNRWFKGERPFYEEETIVPTGWIQS
jgi:hypothetical protein